MNTARHALRARLHAMREFALGQVRARAQYNTLVARSVPKEQQCHVGERNLGGGMWPLYPMEGNRATRRALAVLERMAKKAGLK